MNADTASAWARLRSALYNPSRRLKPGKALVDQADLELLLAEVEQLSNAQMARFLVKITLEALANGEQGTSGKAQRAAQGRARRHPLLRGPHWPATDRRVAAVDTVQQPDL